MFSITSRSKIVVFIFVVYANKDEFTYKIVIYLQDETKKNGDEK